MVEEVDDKSLDVGAILVLVSHDQEFPVAQASQLCTVGVLLGVVEAQNLDNVGYLFVIHELETAETCTYICMATRTEPNSTKHAIHVQKSTDKHHLLPNNKEALEFS